MEGELFHVMKLTVGFNGEANAHKMIGNKNVFITPKSCTAVFPQFNSRGHLHTGKNTQRISHHITTAADCYSLRSMTRK